MNDINLNGIAKRKVNWEWDLYKVKMLDVYHRHKIKQMFLLRDNFLHFKLHLSTLSHNVIKQYTSSYK